MKKVTRWILPLLVALSIGVPVLGSYIIPDFSITQQKLQTRTVSTTVGAGGVALINLPLLTQNVFSTSPVQIAYSGTPLAVTITTSAANRPVEIHLQAAGGSAAPLQFQPGTSADIGTVYVYRNVGATAGGSAIGAYNIQSGSITVEVISSAVSFLDTTASANTQYTYTIYASTTSAGDSFHFFSLGLVAWEI